MKAPLPLRGEAKIVFSRPETRELKVKFSFESMSRMEERIGLSLTEVAQQTVQMKLKMSTIVGIIYEGALEAKEKITFKEIGELLIENGVHVIGRMVLEPLMKMMVAGKDEVQPGEAPEKEESQAK